MAYNPCYDAEEELFKKRLRFLFTSSGKREIVKAIEYTAVADNGKSTIYNLAFGDYDNQNDLVMDKTNSNNGDMYQVFYTVLNSVTAFYNQFPNDAIFIQGSDNSHDYYHECLPTCQKKCTVACKNANRRIKTYRSFINKNFQKLDKSYRFMGAFKHAAEFVPYELGMEYDAILVFQRN